MSSLWNKKTDERLKMLWEDTSAYDSLIVISLGFSVYQIKKRAHELGLPQRPASLSDRFKVPTRKPSLPLNGAKIIRLPEPGALTLSEIDKLNRQRIAAQKAKRAVRRRKTERAPENATA